MALCAFSMSNMSEHTLGLIHYNALITEWCEERGLGSREHLGAAAFTGKCREKHSQWDLTTFFKMRSPVML